MVTRKRLTTLTLVDVVAAPPSDDRRVESVAGDVADPALLDRLIDRDTTSVFHLAAIVSGQAEADFDLGMRVNFDATRALLEVCRARGHRPRVVFASSCAVYGGELPPVVPGNAALTPQSSYGSQKAMGELLVNDYSRRGFVDGRALRLPTISVRPGQAQRRAVVVRQRRDSRAAQRRRVDLPGAGHHAGLAALAGDGDRRASSRRTTSTAPHWARIAA